jgi:hypothetical protein
LDKEEEKTGKGVNEGEIEAVMGLICIHRLTLSFSIKMAETLEAS